MLIEILRALYTSEINVSISCLWDGGWDVALGDELNGFKAERNFANDALHHVARWLAEQAKVHYPESTFAKTR